ncbi:glycosyltransferase family 4 protein [Halopseudomonas pachastrellae]|uniref:glycosyltransferase family 4 protein n=1 Tax=Halopseudomonas pachastrellae TaxID=254161 RepID=UPI003D7D1743
MKSILMIHQSSELYGSDKTFLSLVKYFIKFKVNVIAVIPSNGPLEIELLNVGATVIIRPILKAQRSMFSIKTLFYLFKSFLSSLFFYNSLIKNKKINYVYSNTIAVLDGAIIKLISKEKVKHIWHIHEILEDLGFFNKIYGHMIGQYADLVITNSKATKHYVERLTCKSEICVIYNGIDPTPYKNTKEPTNKKNKGDRLVIGLVGRMNDWKGHCLLLKAFELIDIDEMNLKIIFKGSPSPSKAGYAEILQSISNNRYRENIEIVSFQKDPATVWSDIDICVVPSTKPEPFGLVVIEAMAARIPVIAANHGGPSELIDDEVTGFLFTPNNAESLAACIEKSIANFDKIGAMVDAAERNVLTNYTEKVFAEKTHAAIISAR